MGIPAPFPWFGGKSRVAHEVWARFGDTPNYVEPFFGSGAVLLGRPEFDGLRTETVNDLDGFLANFWRAVSKDGAAVAAWADSPVNEVDLHARHVWLIGQRDTLVARLMGDPDYYDAKIAGWWCWGLCCWIGSGWCSGKGPWQSVDGVFQRLGDAGRGVNKQLPHLSNAGQGVNKKLPHLSNAGQGVNKQLPHLSNAGQGVNKKLPHLGNAGRGVNKQLPLYEWFAELQERLRYVRVACGDWQRMVTPAVTERNGTTAVFLDPPYPSHDRAETYTHDSGDVAYAVRDWAIANGGNPQLRIALCGYDGHWEMPDDWYALAWKAAGGYGSQGKNTRGAANSHRERVWFSPHCLPALNATLRAEEAMLV